MQESKLEILSKLGSTLIRAKEQLNMSNTLRHEVLCELERLGVHRKTVVSVRDEEEMDVETAIELYMQTGYVNLSELLCAVSTEIDELGQEKS